MNRDSKGAARVQRPAHQVELAGLSVDTRHFIGGERVASVNADGSAATFESVSPIDGAVLAHISRGGATLSPPGATSAPKAAARFCIVSPTSLRPTSSNSPNSRPSTTARCCAATAAESCRASP